MDPESESPDCVVAGCEAPNNDGFCAELAPPNNDIVELGDGKSVPGMEEAQDQAGMRIALCSLDVGEMIELNRVEVSWSWE